VPSEFARDTGRIYSEMYEEGIEPFRWPHEMSARRFPPLESRAAWRNFAILMLLGIAIVVIPIVYAINHLA